MAMILCTREEQSRSLAHGLILCSPEEAFLMHYRVGGEKKGQRRWQDESGRLTKAGYEHYATMYGWGKRLEKAEKLQNKADKKSERAVSATRRSDEATVKAYNASRRNDRHTTDRNQKKADKLNAESARQKALAAQANLAATKAQNKAVDYADKLQRKEDREAKYRNEDGTLNEKGLEKYTYPTLNPGERKMSLLGRIKFGNDYADKFNNENKMKMTKDEYKQWEQNEREKFEAESKYEEHISQLARNMDKFDKLSKEDQQKTGQEVMDMIEAASQDYKNLTHDERKNFEGAQDWLWQRIDAKSGNWNVGEFRDGTKGKEANDKLGYEYDKQNAREEEIKREIGYKPAPYTKFENNSILPLTGMAVSEKRDKQRKNENARLQRALNSDSIYQTLKENSKKAENDLCGAVLKDMGFPDTPSNRSLIFSYVFVM